MLFKLVMSSDGRLHVCNFLFEKEMVTGIQSRFFVGGDNGKTPKYSMTDMDKHHFK